ncbi:HK97 family phage prohead protease [Peribacillus simplex]|uniref:HK97 family phage prohead protease n=1 Tax=Peribacillus simplex TaxID=1478 RepID=UPI00333D6BE2
MKEKAIYGLASTYGYPVIDHELIPNVYKINTKLPGSFLIDPLLVVITRNHDYSKEIGWIGLDGWTNRKDPNVTLVLNERGLFFKLIPNSPLGLEFYELVKEGLMTQCSITYKAQQATRDYRWEKNLEFLASLRGDTDKYIVHNLSEIIISEICICEQGKNQETFATVNGNDPRLKGIKFGA